MAPQNHLLNALPRTLYEKLDPHLKLVRLERGQRIHEPGAPIIDLYFPLDCALSITLSMLNGDTAETGIIGKREVLGINAFMGGRETTQTTYIVQVAGSALRLDAKVLLDEFDTNKEMRDVMLLYTQAFIAQISQTTACNTLHSMEQRFARWLLEVQDRMEQPTLRLTQEFIAEMIGVRRAGVTQTAQRFQEAGLIRYHRGTVEILDLPGLEASACECFRMVKDEYDRLLGEIPSLSA
ncbi:Crp/Fnr family transcriptional regulator [Leptolyngbya sp. FACHB-321]|uniref:Crp/Fnr family transcriptional regulator n=1 Tax=Leptolyngbya sp. FACHB-321 TaxID=2692807 RepID=UPI001682ECB8|nr:Crp/Fnr family transcriptional regulator [Leptolyngbya sp. FACHB-321]MBD2037054.1 Crp/Fnr family transcriptional regulator [Leptolyngbya sp. FACHB-321]